ncbi:unnamed protein product [Calypogeia fissa]
MIHPMERYQSLKWESRSHGFRMRDIDSLEEDSLQNSMNDTLDPSAPAYNRRRKPINGAYQRTLRDFTVLFSDSAFDRDCLLRRTPSYYLAFTYPGSSSIISYGTGMRACWKGGSPLGKKILRPKDLDVCTGEILEASEFSAFDPFPRTKPIAAACLPLGTALFVLCFSVCASEIFKTNKTPRTFTPTSLHQRCDAKEVRRH